MTKYIHCYLTVGASQSIGAYGDALLGAIESTPKNISWGRNGLFICDSEIEVIGCIDGACEKFSHAFGYATKSQRALAHRSQMALDSSDKNSYSSELKMAMRVAAPVIIVFENADLYFYHLIHHTVSGALYLRYFAAKKDLGDGPSNLSLLRRYLRSASSRWNAIRALLSDNCGYTKWRSDIEMERKFTFESIPDTWSLINALHAEIRVGALAKFIPELDRDFQVFDYESTIFAVGGNPSNQGYISFIPQADGRTTVKRKWFTKNAEIRRETLYPNLIIPYERFSAVAEEMAGSEIQALPAFRRKRFDVNFESLATGNVYGVYFDICRISENHAHGFSQCEVEYCRSRTFDCFRDVEEEFELVANFTRDFLLRYEQRFQHDMYSKLDFVRSAATFVNK